jgi:hypothetical protein
MAVLAAVAGSFGACKCSPRRMQVLTTAVAGSFGACKCSPRRMQVLTTAVAGSFGVSVSVSRQALISNSQTHLETNERSHTNE